MRSFLKLALTACLVLGFGSTSAFAQINIEKLLAGDGEAGDSFGVSVSLSGDRVLVGAFLDDDKGAVAGAAYVFVRSGSGWALESKLVPADGAAGDYFG